MVEEKRMLTNLGAKKTFDRLQKPANLHDKSIV